MFSFVVVIVCLMILFCWYVDIWKNNHLSQSLWTVFRQGTSSAISPTRDSAGLSNLPWGCIISGPTSIISPVKWCACFYSVAPPSVCLWSFNFSGSGVAGRSAALVLSGPQVFKACWFPTCILSQERNQSPEKHPQNPDIGCMFYLFLLLLKEKPWVWRMEYSR